ncbi:MAG: hypothetical protein WCG98_06965 [bacterium]
MYIPCSVNKNNNRRLIGIKPLLMYTHFSARRLVYLLSASGLIDGKLAQELEPKSPDLILEQLNAIRKNLHGKWFQFEGTCSTDTITLEFTIQQLCWDSGGITIDLLGQKQIFIQLVDSQCRVTYRNSNVRDGYTGRLTPF